MKVATCTICRLENNYLIEFVEYYKAIGVDHMFIYDNNIPGTENVIDVLQSYVNDGFVTVVNWQDQESYPMGPGLKLAFNDCWNSHKDEYDWILFLDNDEFLTFTKDHNIKKYLSRQCFNNVDVIRVNWLCYDDNNLIYYEDKPLRERFTHPCKDDPYLFDENRHIKSIVHNTIQKNNIFTDSINPAHTPEVYTNNFIICDNTGELYSKDFNQIEFSENINYELAYYAHYRMKTIDEYINNKILKLDKQGYSNLSFTSHLFFRYNKWTKEKEELFINNVSKYSKNVVYTCIIGNYDTLNEVEYKTPGWDYICFTNNPSLTSGSWQIRLLTEKEIQDFNDSVFYCKWWKNWNQYLNRYIKLHPHKFLQEYDFSIYVDGNITLCGDLNEFKKTYIDTEGSYKYIMWALKHSDRTCVYDEIDKCIELHKDDELNIRRLEKMFRNENVPQHLGLSQNCVICRYHKEQELSSLMSTWWEYIKEYTVRDQCSLYYVLFKSHKLNNIKLLFDRNNKTYFDNLNIHIKTNKKENKNNKTDIKTNIVFDKGIFKNLYTNRKTDLLKITTRTDIDKEFNYNTYALSKSLNITYEINTPHIIQIFDGTTWTYEIHEPTTYDIETIYNKYEEFIISTSGVNPIEKVTRIIKYHNLENYKIAEISGQFGSTVLNNLQKTIVSRYDVYEIEPSLCNLLKNRLSNYKDIVNIIEGDALETLAKIDDIIYDVVFFDCTHNYDLDKKILNVLNNHIDSHTILIFHDYDMKDQKRLIDEYRNIFNCIIYGLEPNKIIRLK